MVYPAQHQEQLYLTKNSHSGKLEEIYVCTVNIISSSDSKPFEVTQSHFKLVRLVPVPYLYSCSMLLLTGTGTWYVQVPVILLKLNI